MPYLLDTMGYEPGDNFTAVIFVQIGSQLTQQSALFKLVKNIIRSQFIDKILILWSSDRPIPSKKRWPNTGHVSLHIIPGIVNEER